MQNLIPTEYLNYFSIADVYNVRIETAEEMKARLVEQANQYLGITHHQPQTFADLNYGPVPDMLITYDIGHSDSNCGEVYVELWFTGHTTDDGRKVYDMGFSTINNDVWGMVQTYNAIGVAMQKHYELGLHKRFPMIGEPESAE